MKRIRVLHIIDSFDQGGGQVVLLNLAEACRPGAVRRVSCDHARQRRLLGCFRSARHPVYSLSPRKWLPLYVPNLLRLLAREKFDIVHCHLFGANWIAKPLAALAGVPVLINHDHCNDRLRYDQPIARWLDTWTNRLSSHVCAVSASTRDFVVEEEGVPADGFR